jgi:thioredoxin reductase (NADPH)
MAEKFDTAFPTLTDADMAVLDALGTRRPVDAGEYLFREGDVTYDFHVVTSGAIEIVSHDGTEEQVIAEHGPGKFIGELNLLTGMRVFVSARAVEPGEVIVVPRDSLRRLIATSPGLGDTILTALMARRSVLLTGASASLRIIGSRFCPDCQRLREFVARCGIPSEWIDPDSDPAVDALLQQFAIDPGELPVVITSGSVLRRPTPGSLAEYLGLTVQSLPDRCFDLVVVGGGPAGLAASVYGASEGLRTLGLEKFAVGGQAGSSSRIENYLGFPTGISGGDLTRRAMIQAEKFGAALTAPCEAVSLREEAGHLILGLSDGTELAARAVIVASGARYRRLPVDRLDEFEGTSVYYAATEMERRECGAAPVIVVGGGNSAGQAAMFLSDTCASVTIVIRAADLGKSMSRYLTDRIERHPRITVRTEAQITKLVGDQDLQAVEITDTAGTTEVPCTGLFSFIGADPSSDWISGCAALDSRGFVLTDRALGPEDLDERWAAQDRLPLPFETSHPGLFAVGDVRAGSTKRVAGAVGEGSACVGAVHQYLSFGH